MNVNVKRFLSTILLGVFAGSMTTVLAMEKTEFSSVLFLVESKQQEEIITPLIEKLQKVGVPVSLQNRGIPTNRLPFVIGAQDLVISVYRLGGRFDWEWLETPLKFVLVREDVTLQKYGMPENLMVGRTTLVDIIETQKVMLNLDCYDQVLKQIQKLAPKLGASKAIQPAASQGVSVKQSEQKKTAVPAQVGTANAVVPAIETKSVENQKGAVRPIIFITKSERTAENMRIVASALKERGITASIQSNAASLNTHALVIYVYQVPGSDAQELLPALVGTQQNSLLIVNSLTDRTRKMCEKYPNIILCMGEMKDYNIIPDPNTCLSKLIELVHK